MTDCNNIQALIHGNLSFLYSWRKTNVNFIYWIVLLWLCDDLLHAPCWAFHLYQFITSQKKKFHHKNYTLP